VQLHAEPADDLAGVSEDQRQGGIQLIGGESSGAALAVMTLLRLRGAIAFAANLAFGCQIRPRI
jgi:hypothetical protein